LRSADNGALGQKIVDWQHRLEQKWDTLRFGAVKVETLGEQHRYEVQIYLNDLDPNTVAVELYADGIHGSFPERHDMQRDRQLVGASNGYVYSVAVSAARPATDYTARVIPRCKSVAVPLEASQILWQRSLQDRLEPI
jgi:starch phosphorylase